MSLEFKTSKGMTGRRLGEGPALVFIHGWCLDHRMWMYAAEAFRGDHCVIMPDLAGFGRSDAMLGPYSWERYADDLAGMLDELDVRDAVLVGFAFGAGVAMTLAARGEARVKAVVAVGAPAAESSPYRKMAKAALRDWPDFARRSAQALFHRPQSDATLAWIERMFSSAPLPVAFSVLDLLAEFDPRPLASGIAAPQHFIQASEDRVSPVLVGSEAAASAPKGSSVVISDCGHLIVLDAKEQFHDALRQYLNSLPLNSR